MVTSTTTAGAATPNNKRPTATSTTATTSGGGRKTTPFNKTTPPKTPSTRPTTVSTATAASNNNDVVVLDFLDTASFATSSSSSSPSILTEAQLKVLSEESSTYVSIAPICLLLTQMAGGGMNGNGGTAVHPPSFADAMSRVWEALRQCVQHNIHRQCRCIAAQTLAITGKAAYAQIRPSPLLFSQTYPAIRTIEDEVASDIPMVLCTAALDDSDDGVAASCFSALSILLGTGSVTTYGGVMEDELAVHISHLVRGGGGGTGSPYAPGLRSVVDEDMGVVVQELSVRIVENIVAPRLLQLMDRVIRMMHSSTSSSSSHDYITMSLPCIVSCLGYAITIHPITLYQTDRMTYSKRWSEWDVASLIDTVIYSLILPAMDHALSGSLRLTAALAAIRCIHVQPYKPWVLPVCRAAMSIFQYECCTVTTTGSSIIETKLTLLAAMMVSCRVRPIIERTRTLIWLAQQISSPTLPSTVSTMVVCAGLRIDMGNAFIISKNNNNNNSPQTQQQQRTFCSYRRPTRMALWTETALSFFLDGPSSSSSTSSPATSTTQQPISSSTAGVVPTGTTITTLRHEALSIFFHCPTLQRIMSVDDAAVNNIDTKQTPSLLRQQRDELLLAFTSVAVETGRRFRAGVGDTTTGGGSHSSVMVADPSCDAVHEWLALVRVVLQAFSNCVFVATTGSYLDENLSLLTAGLARYVQLLQEYLHFVGLLHPSSSVALKLGANACPPHILWDRMTESASFLSRYEGSDFGCLDHTTKLLDDLVSREMKVGIPSHPMRLFVLALAADHWVQGRASVIRKHFTTAGSAVDISMLNMPSGRDVLLALAPKRLLDKIIQAHIPPTDSDGKPKRDPIKKLALESARVSVACIENIALMACDWRRRFGSSPESKHIVSVAVGLLQGKIDETPMDELTKSVMGPICDAAVSRIQAFYESPGPGASDHTFPLSSLVTQPVKIKIKPLVSSSKPNPRPKDDVMLEYLMQLCRQIVAARIQLSVDSCPHADSLLTAARPANWLRLSIPPVPASRDGRIYGCHIDAMSAWGHSVCASSAASDAIQLMVAYTPRRHVRYDGEDEYRITILMKAFNMTPLDILEGVRLELGILQRADALEDDPATQAHIKSLALLPDPSLSSRAVDFKQEIKSGEYISWEVDLLDMPISNSIQLVPSIIYRNVPAESDDVGVKYVGDKVTDGEGSTVGAESQNGEDDFQVTMSDEANSMKGETDVITNVRFVGEPITLPPLIVCQPCPLVFFTNRCGDLDSFRFLWFRFPYCLAPLRVIRQVNPDQQHANPITQKIAAMSSLTWDGEAIPGGIATHLWAFQSLSGHRIFCVLTDTDSHNEAESQQTLHFRGDDQQLLYSFIGSRMSRDSVISSLMPGMVSTA